MRWFVGMDVNRAHESFWGRRRMWFSVKGIRHVATSGTQSRSQICKSNKLPSPRGMSQQTQLHIDSVGPQQGAAVDDAGDFISIRGSFFTTFLVDCRSTTTCISVQIKRPDIPPLFRPTVLLHISRPHSPSEVHPAPSGLDP